MADPRLSMLGLCAKAGMLVSGGFMTERAIQTGEALFVIIAEDASANTKKKFTNKCEFYQIPCVICGNQYDLGHMIGKEDRTTIAVIDEGFARQLLKKFNLDKDLEV